MEHDLRLQREEAADAKAKLALTTKQLEELERANS